jgi:hypothetical protein
MRLRSLAPLLLACGVGIGIGYFWKSTTALSPQAAAAAARPLATSVAPPASSQVLVPAKSTAPEHSLGPWQQLISRDSTLGSLQRQGWLAGLLASGLTVAEALLKMESLPEDQREPFAVELAKVWLEKSAPEAAEFVQALGDSPVRPSVTENLLETWSRRDPAQAAAWAWQQRPVCSHGPAMVLQRWASEDAPNASAWLVTIPPGPEREQMAVLLAEKLLETDPTAARGWIDSLQDPAAQENLRQRLAE